jgi:hypothetical protein
MSLLDRIRKAREQKVEAGGVKFTIRRPTDLDMMEMAGTIDARRLIPFVCGWDGVTEGHIVRGGDPHPLPFDAEACAEWLADRPDILAPLVEAIISAYSEHAKKLADEKKP